ncbi:hypothetical protein DPEC_G00217460 [Dallia pectoralis]|uniref:Uncharacterized protein n=1 Tax=Dallia pectoralis TaxID=75939 RepID=A0ACC2G2Y2_DALPE|nr:hypothetical protein DPEC_G00217460 [Dallia pectoralis]
MRNKVVFINQSLLATKTETIARKPQSTALLEHLSPKPPVMARTTMFPLDIQGNMSLVKTKSTKKKLRTRQVLDNGIWLPTCYIDAVYEPKAALAGGEWGTSLPDGVARARAQCGGAGKAVAPRPGRSYSSPLLRPEGSVSGQTHAT